MAHFEAEFAIKLFKSDKENLLNEIKHLTVEEVFDSQRMEASQRN